MTWLRPEYTLPVPRLDFAFHLEVTLDPLRKVGQTAQGAVRYMVSFREGSLSGPCIQGRLLPGGADWLTSSDDVAAGTRTSLLDTRYGIETDDGAIIYLQTNGVRTGQIDVLDSLSTDASVPASAYSMRLSIKAETDRQCKHAWLNSAILIASAGRTISPSGQDMVIYDAYLIT
ncbi:uncharacterized protein L969DRAFT_84326 [Mixia osmundae IAM 14324]|uniref:Uncharacterized protein n=1 Tax=Mixia osmundae (strain CBS 9802 / IAM 14324 / JCM 22182 / KY 12970) TaxID=764103 RepID=G7E362_MIXOS|nr:uncharacterized protein L969DRAFT_84326 [Mixia osmundae IAM 14324]KEI42469.1 hypothetical protein L969DRAFT_84326 [Mixia osmundae IAM 14324]GAA97243.1 hypothetical protein E5Q_03920 [Mixia osmundae IAM 14324]